MGAQVTQGVVQPSFTYLECTYILNRMIKEERSDFRLTGVYTYLCFFSRHCYLLLWSSGLMLLSHFTFAVVLVGLVVFVATLVRLGYLNISTCHLRHLRVFLSPSSYTSEKYRCPVCFVL